MALYLATLAMRDAAPEDLIETASRFAGDDRLIVEYVREELLDTLPRRFRTFLVHVSILDELERAMHVTRSWNEMIPHDSWRTPHVRCRS